MTQGNLKLVALIGAIAISCLSAKPVSSTSKRFTYYADKTPGDSIVWSSERKLSFSDFRTVSTISRYGATTEYLLNYRAVPLNGDSTRYRVAVTAEFLKQGSWMQESADSIDLAHEQGHFDLAEVYALLFKKALVQAHCDTFDAAHRLEGIDKVGEMYERYNENTRHMQEMYDTETRGGNDAFMQERWYTRIANDLRALEDYM